METPKHTPLPWYKTASSPDGYIYGADNKCIVEFGPETAGHMDEERWANAEFVVLACNAHDDLLETLRECITEDGACCLARDRKDYMIRRLAYITDIASAAIAKATETE